MQGWVVTRPWGLLHSTNTYHIYVYIYMRIYVIQLQSATVGSLLVLLLWWKTIRSRGIECCFHCFVFSQSGNSQLISAKKIRQANFIHWQNTGKYQFNKALLRFPTQGRTIWVCTFRSVCLYNVTKTSTKNALSWFLRLFLAWSRPGFGDSWTCNWRTKGPRVHLGIQKGSLCRQAPWKHKCSGSKNKIKEKCIKPMESNWISASILPHDHINANPWCLPSKARYKVTAVLQC